MASATVSTIYENTFKNIYDLIDTNKISGSKVIGGYPNLETDLPSYTIHPTQPSISKVSKDDQQEYDMTVEIELWCEGSDLKIKIDQMKQSIMNTINDNVASLWSNNITKSNDWYDDTNVETVEINERKYHTGNVMLRFDLV